MMRSKFLVAALFLAAAVPALSQTKPEAIESSWQVNVGAGVSGYNDDYYENQIMEGIGAWVDVYPNRGPNFLHGLGLELEGHDIRFGAGASQPSNLREDTGGGGAIYSWRHFRNLSPYGKFLYEQGSIDFIRGPGYNHDDRSLYAFGGGVDYRVWRHLSIRADYEAQFWQALFVNHAVTTPSGLSLRPQGITLGASYEFHRIHVR